MALVTTKEMFRKAYEGAYAIGAFNVDNIDIMQGVLSGAKKAQSPVIVAFSEGALKFIHPAYVRKAAEAAAEEMDIPFAIHLDHGKSVELCKQCVDNGFTSVMIDASAYDFEKNIALTKEVVQYAHDRGVVVESELGAIAGIEDDIVVDDKYGQFTHPDDAVEFVERTGIDSLAIAIGTAHGAYKFMLRKASTMGVCKINVGTDIRVCFFGEIRKQLFENPAKFDGRTFLGPARTAVEDMVAKRITEVFGSAGKA